MAGAYKATIDVKCWKEHTCCFCGSPYRYLVRRKMIGKGPSQSDAAVDARSNAVRAFRDEVLLRPCPGCGNYQPDMIGARRLARHGVLFLVMLGVLLVLFLLGAFELAPTSLTLILLLFCAGAILLINTWIGARNPNRNLRTNKAYAERLAAAQELQAVPASTEGEERPRAVVIETGVGYWMAFLLLGATAVLLPGAELLRLAGGWRMNPGWHPGIVGPGDTAWTWINVDKPLGSLRGEWRATGTGEILNAQAFKMKDAKLPKVTSRDASWSDFRSMAGTEAIPIRLWAQVTFPPNRPFERSRVTIKLDLHVTVLETDPKDPARVIEKVHKDLPPYLAEVELATHRAGFQYVFFWYVAMLGGGSMFLLGAGYHLMRDHALKKCGLATRVVPVADLAGGESAPPPRAAAAASSAAAPPVAAPPAAPLAAEPPVAKHIDAEPTEVAVPAEPRASAPNEQAQH